MKTRPDWRALLQLAYAQGGYFRTTHAAAAGFSNQLLHKHRLAGRISRKLRGVYRLVDVPPGEHDDLVALWLWSEELGVFSHETALALHELSDALPARVHMTVPRAWSRHHVAPRLLMLHRANIPADERTWVGSIPVTSVARTLRDVLDEGIDPDLLTQAVAEAKARRLVERADLRGIVSPRRGRGAKRHGAAA
ncbi:MAG TPA: type IV toxin-antitoxin system AbiEi family antitoxin domain-containing protein [Kofleriaceae bacterium]|nr:type IV toxin-antitoxin system AbiEi family antitoxin domain-containing protein [Kofleriaceae bacterium]